MNDLFIISLSFMADASRAVSTVRDYVIPTVRALSALGAVACTFFIVNAGYLYITSSGKPEQMDHAKRVLKNALLGLVVILAAVTLTTILTSSFGQPAGGQEAALPALEAIPPQEGSSGLVDVLIKAVVGFLNAIIQAVGAPFLAALDYFTEATPLMTSNSSVFNLWLAIVGITNVLFILVLALIGFHVMSAASFGFDEIEIKHLLPRIGLIFLLINTSIFAIDGIIRLSNVLITAIGQVSGSASPWEVLSLVVGEAGGQGLAALLLMLAFIIFSVILLIYYVGRLVTLFIGAVLSPLVILIWLVPGFRDFSESAAKTYLSTIFVLFVHVVILQLAASLFVGMSIAGDSPVPDTLMSMVVGLATIVALLKTQGAMMQLSYASMGARNTRKLGGQFMNGVSYMTGKTKSAASTISSKTDSAKKTRMVRSIESRAASTGKPQTIRYQNKQGTAEITHTATPTKLRPTAKTGIAYNIPKVAVTRISHPRNNSKDKTL